MKKTFLKIMSFIALMLCLSINSMCYSKVYKDNFTFNLLSKMDKSHNFMFSPVSIEYALMVLANGVCGDSQREILDILGIDDLSLHNEELKSFSEYINEQNIMKIDNSLWFNKHYVDSTKFYYNENYLHTIGENFSAEAYKVSSYNAVSEINRWVNNKTNGKIKQIIDNPRFLSVILNAVYFKKNWKIPFEKYNTYRSDFTNLDGRNVQTEFMCNENSFNYYEDSKFQMVELPYQDNNVSMYIFLPKQGDMSGFSYEWIEKGIQNKKQLYGYIKIPKFKIETSIDLKKIVQQLGMNRVFSPNCTDFNGAMFNDLSDNIFISNITHKSFIDVDEQGTEATAVTGIIARCNCLQVPKKRHFEFDANKPFFYLIRDNLKHRSLFVGLQSSF